MEWIWGIVIGLVVAFLVSGYVAAFGIVIISLIALSLLNIFIFFWYIIMQLWTLIMRGITNLDYIVCTLPVSPLVAWVIAGILIAAPIAWMLSVRNLRRSYLQTSSIIGSVAVLSLLVIGLLSASMNKEKFGDELYELGEKAYQGNNYQKAVDYATRAVRILPVMTSGSSTASYNQVQCYVLIGDSYYKIQKDDSALSAYHIAIKSRGIVLEQDSVRLAQTYLRYSGTLIGLEQPLLALDAATTAMNYGADVTTARTRRGAAYFKLARYAEALAEFDTLLAYNIRQPETDSLRLARIPYYMNRAACYEVREKFDYDRADAEYKAILRIDKNNQIAIDARKRLKILRKIYKGVVNIPDPPEAPEPPVPVPPQPPVTPVPPPVKASAGIITGTRVRMRVEPRTESDQVMKFEGNEKVTFFERVSGEGREWYKMQYNGKVGYVVAQYISADNGESKPVPEDSGERDKPEEVPPPVKVSIAREFYTDKGDYIRYTGIQSYTAEPPCRFHADGISVGNYCKVTEFEGRSNVILLHPVSRNQSATMGITTTVPSEGDPVLYASFRSSNQGDVDIEIKARDENGSEQVLTPRQTLRRERGWVDITVPLSYLRGKKVSLTLYVIPTGWSFEVCYVDKFYLYYAP